MMPTGIPGFDELVGGLPKGGLVIVAGGPGTGKTIFSAGFLYWGAVRYGERGVYVSLAEDKKTFIENMKRIGYDFESLERRGLFRFIESLTLMESGTSELLSMIVEEVSEFKARRLVIDSLTALAQGLKEPRELRVFLHSLFSRIMMGLGCTTILIEEMPFGEERIGYGFEEFVASTVIVLEKDYLDDKFLRRMRIEKLRGAPVPNNRACFTLGSGFQVFPPTKLEKLEKPRSPEPPQDPPGGYSTGIRDLDAQIGGYSRGSTVLLEIDRRITRDQYRLITWPQLADFLKKGRPAIALPGMGSSLRDLNAFHSAYAVSEEEKGRMRYFLMVNSVSREGEQGVIPYDPEAGVDALIGALEASADELLKKHGSPPLIFLSMDSIEFGYGEDDALKLVGSISAWTRRNEGLSLLADKLAYPEISERLASVSSIHLRLTREHGCLLLYGVKPRTPLYAIKTDTQKGYYQTRLVPIT